MGVDVPHALVVLAKACRQHEIRAELIHTGDLIGEGHSAREALRETVNEGLDLRKEAEHLLIDSSALGIVVAHGRLRDPHRAGDVNLFHPVGPQKFASEPRANRGKQLGDYKLMGLKHPGEPGLVSRNEYCITRYLTVPLFRRSDDFLLLSPRTLSMEASQVYMTQQRGLSQKSSPSWTNV